MLTGTMPPTRLNIPHEDGQWVEVRLLGWAELQECREALARQFFGKVKDIGPDVFREFSALQAADDAKLAEARAQMDQDDGDASDVFDKATLMQKSVVAWSYPTPYAAALLADLDERTSDWLFKAIVALYAGTAESEEDRGNAYTPSTGI